MVQIDLTLLMPLILLIVVSHSEASRSMDLTKLSISVEPDVLLFHGGRAERVVRRVIRTLENPRSVDTTSAKDPTGSSDSVTSDTEEDDASPSLGRFNHIHGFNTFLLSLTLSTIAIVEHSPTGVFLALIVAVFWMNLPAIEIDEYDEILTHFEPTDTLISLSFHTWTTIVLGLPPIILSYYDVNSLPSWLIYISVASYIVVSILIGNKYISLLDQELQSLQKYLESVESPDAN